MNLYFYSDHLLFVGAQGKVLPSILKKSPEIDDVFNLLKIKSAHWDDFARDLFLDYSFRELLKHEDSLTAMEKLERVLKKWIECESSDVTWSNLMQVLKRLQFLDIAMDVKRYLERKEVIEKYHQKMDYKGQLFKINCVMCYH